MAYYDYICRHCAKEFEKNVPMTTRDHVVCDCGGETFRKITFFGSVYAPSAGGMR